MNESHAMYIYFFENNKITSFWTISVVNNLFNNQNLYENIFVFASLFISEKMYCFNFTANIMYGTIHIQDM